MAVSPAFSICQCEFSSPLRFIPRKKARPLFSNLQDGSEQPSSEPAAIELEFLGPDGKGDVLKTSVKSGEKVLRNVMRENKLELYGLYVSFEGQADELWRGWQLWNLYCGDFRGTRAAKSANQCLKLSEAWYLEAGLPNNCWR